MELITPEKALRQTTEGGGGGGDKITGREGRNLLVQVMSNVPGDHVGGLWILLCVIGT